MGGQQQESCTLVLVNGKWVRQCPNTAGSNLPTAASTKVEGVSYSGLSVPSCTPTPNHESPDHVKESSKKLKDAMRSEKKEAFSEVVSSRSGSYASEYLKVDGDKAYKYAGRDAKGENKWEPIADAKTYNLVDGKLYDSTGKFVADMSVLKADNRQEQLDRLGKSNFLHGSHGSFVVKAETVKGYDSKTKTLTLPDGTVAKEGQMVSAGGFDPNTMTLTLPDGTTVKNAFIKFGPPTGKVASFEKVKGVTEIGSVSESGTLLRDHSSYQIKYVDKVDDKKVSFAELEAYYKDQKGSIGKSFKVGDEEFTISHQQGAYIYAKSKDGAEVRVSISSDSTGNTVSFERRVTEKTTSRMQDGTLLNVAVGWVRDDSVKVDTSAMPVVPALPKDDKKEKVDPVLPKPKGGGPVPKGADPDLAIPLPKIKGAAPEGGIPPLPKPGSAPDGM